MPEREIVISHTLADIRLHLQEVSGEKEEYVVLSKENGYLHDYSHNNMLTHPDARKDHFSRILTWLEEGKF